MKGFQRSTWYLLTFIKLSFRTTLFLQPKRVLKYKFNVQTHRWVRGQLISSRLFKLQVCPLFSVIPLPLPTASH